MKKKKATIHNILQIGIKDLKQKFIRKTKQCTIDIKDDDLSRESFTFKKELGKGAYGIVYLVEHKESKMHYALKVINKESVMRHDKIKAVFRE